MLIRSLALAVMLLPFAAQTAAKPAQGATDALPAGVLQRQQAGGIMPATVFFRGQTSTIQARNSAGIKLADGKLVLTAIVDTSGYSSAVQQSYQAYLINEVPLNLGGHTLQPGAYGYGFVAGNAAVVMDLGGNELFRTPTSLDDKLARPTPLQIIASDGGVYRLYLGRQFVTLNLPAK